MTTTRRPDADRLRTLAAQCRLWVLDAMAWLAELLGAFGLGAGLRKALADDVRRLRKGVRAIVILLAIDAYGRAPAPHGPAPHVLRPPPGFARRPARGSLVRHATRRLRFGARDLRGRLARLAAVLDDLDRCVAKLAFLSDWVAPQRQPTPVRPPAASLRTMAQRAPAIADSS